MTEMTDAEISAALERGKVARLHEPRAAAARYDRQLDRVIVDLTNGCTFAFPPRLAQGLENATEDQLAQVEILGTGYGLHWEVLDADLSIPGLLAGLFGTSAYMARRAGKMTSPAKAAAARSNGARGGRPRQPAERALHPNWPLYPDWWLLDAMNRVRKVAEDNGVPAEQLTVHLGITGPHQRPNAPRRRSNYEIRLPNGKQVAVKGSVKGHPLNQEYPDYRDRGVSDEGLMLRDLEVEYERRLNMSTATNAGVSRRQ